MKFVRTATATRRAAYGGVSMTFKVSNAAADAAILPQPCIWCKLQEGFNEDVNGDCRCNACGDVQDRLWSGPPPFAEAAVIYKACGYCGERAGTYESEGGTYCRCCGN